MSHQQQMGQISSILVSMGVTDLQIGLAKMLWGIDEEQIEVRISELEAGPPKLSTRCRAFSLDLKTCNIRILGLLECAPLKRIAGRCRLASAPA